MDKQISKVGTSLQESGTYEFFIAFSSLKLHRQFTNIAKAKSNCLMNSLFIMLTNGENYNGENG